MTHSFQISRRSALAGLSGGIVSAGLTPVVLAAAKAPVLATPAQIEAEATLLRLLRDPEIKRLGVMLSAELATTPRGRTTTGAATVGHAVALWTNSLLMGEMGIHERVPAITWSTDNTPRSWIGHTLPGVGTSGDNPDAIYRSATIEGSQRYEVLGRFDTMRRPAQMTLELHMGAKVTPPPMDAKTSDLTPLASINDGALNVAPDGSFRFTIGPRPESPVHLTSKPGLLTLGFRDILSDWTQRPASLELKTLDNAPPRRFSDADILRAAYRDLPPYIRFWSRFPDTWLGGLSGNRVTPVQPRSGALAGFMAGLSFDLADDEAIIVTRQSGGARYMGFQIIDPWMIAASAKQYQNCLNLSQSAPSSDGSFTYVLSRADPGVANWLSTAGIRQGFGIMRWQAVPDTVRPNPAELIRGFRVVKLAEVAAMRDLPRVTPRQRRAQMAARVRDYGSRTL